MYRRCCLLFLAALGCQAPGVTAPGAGGNKGDAAAAGADGPGDEPSGPTLHLPDSGAPMMVPAPTCAQETHAAEKMGVDLLLLVDTSDSMLEMSGTETKWSRMRAALGAFVKDRGSAGLGVGVSFFPGSTPTLTCQRNEDCPGKPDAPASCTGEGVCVAPGVPILDAHCAPGLVSPFNCPAGLTCQRGGRCSASGERCYEGGPACPGGANDRCVIPPGHCRTKYEICDVGNFGKLDVDVGDLPGNAAAVMDALAGREPDGTTPMVRAVESVVAALASRAPPATPRRRALILATDGYPSCEGQTLDAVVDRLQAAYGGRPSLPTYVVGVFSNEQVDEARMRFGRLATAGGTGAPLILTTGDDLAGKLLGALTAIRDQVVACDYLIPQPKGMDLDLGKVNVSATGGNQTVELGRVSAANQCGARRAWYYDVPATAGANPTRVVLCPESCRFVQGDAAAHVDLTFGCATRIVE